MRLGNGKWESYAYNNRQQITEIALGNSATDKSLLKLEYGYGNATENNGNLRTQKISFNGLSQPFEQTYTYDSLNRLKSATETVSGVQNPTWKQTFEYDRFGNRRFDAANTTTLGSCSQAQCNPSINTSDNRFSSGQNYSYDENGNLTRDTNSKKFTYDAENHQIKVETVDANGTPIATNGEYLYDGEGKRVKKIAGTETTIFVYNGGGQLVAEYSTQTVTTPQVSYLTADHLGSARVITNQNGAVTTRKDYMAFGDETASAQRTSGLNYDSSETRKGYTGYEKDTESGLEFAQARYYNSQHGRFTSVDPLTASGNIKNPQTFNRYSYVLNSPYKFTDPLGLISSSTGACGSWCQGSDGGGGGYSSNYDSGNRNGPQMADELRARQAIFALALINIGVSPQVAYESAYGHPFNSNHQTSTPMTLKINVGDPKHLLTKDQFAAMKEEISRIYAEAGINVVFTNENFIYNLQVAEQDPNPTTVGSTPLTDDGKGVKSYGQVFVNNLQASATLTSDGKTAFEQNSLALGIGLGRAGSHEIGHFLLQQNFDSSSIKGVMRAGFIGKEWFSIETQKLWKFDPNQIATMKTNIMNNPIGRVPMEPSPYYDLDILCLPGH